MESEGTDHARDASCQVGTTPTRAVKRASTGVSAATPSVAPAASLPPPSLPVTLSSEALRSEEMGRVRVTVRVLAGVAGLALALTPVMGGDPFAQRVFVVGLVAGLAIMAVMLHNARDAERYSIHVVGTGSLALALASTCAVYYMGPFSPAGMVGALGLYIFCLGGSARWAFALYAVLAGAHALLGFGTLFTLLRDRGLVRPEGLSHLSQLAVQGCVQGVYLIAFVAGRASRTKLEGAVAELERAARQVAQRDALLYEAKRELARTAWVGGEGRFTDQVIGSFKLGNILGRGGMGEVYEAVRLITHEDGAVKLLQRTAFADPESRARFAREARAAAAIVSPHVVRVVEISDEDAPVPYLAMERLRGEDLSSMLRRERQLSPRDLDRLARHVGRAVDAARDAQVVHRDIKPQNLFLARDGDAAPLWKVLDFGVSKLLGQHSLTHDQLVGTPEYMAPEQAEGSAVDHRADLYALCAVLYRCIAGRAPFVDDSLAALVHRAVNHMPPRPGAFARVSEDVEAFLAIGLSKQPDQRFQSGRELSDAFAAAQGGVLPEPLRERAQAILARTPWHE